MKYKVNHNQDLKETVLKTLKEVVESGEVDPWIKQDEIEKSWDNPNMSLNLPLSSLDDTGKENFETKLADKAQKTYNISMYPDSYHNLPHENINVQDTKGKLAMDAMSDKDYKREFGRTTMPTQIQSIAAKLNYNEQKERIRNIAKKLCEELLVDDGEETPANNFLDGKNITLTSRGGSFTAKITHVDNPDPEGIKLYAEIGHTSVVITLSEDEYYELVRGPHGTAHAQFQAENNTLPPTDCTLRVD